MPKGGQPGNSNATKNKLWSETLRRALLADDGKKLRALADRLIERAQEGDTSALKEIGDRLDGKPAQSITGADGGPIESKVDVTGLSIEQLRALASIPVRSE